MDAHRRRVRGLFRDAMERPPSERDAFLKQACKADEALRREVEDLLRSLDEAGDFLETPARAWDAEALDVGMIHRQIGRYRIVRPIGRGGMGTVYLAVRSDQAFEKRVAVKLLEPGLDREKLARYLKTERQILAALDHPNITRLLDGGTTPDGLPYLVMDYIEGQPIDRYCDAHHLGIRQRLELFRTVCLAVHFAHQNLIVHRDLKPANVLVTAGGVPKLLDFGIAKLLNPELSTQPIAPTLLGQSLMTPEYASPEQVQGQPITTATDIYSLGVLLYNLLTGHPPYRLRSHAPGEVVKVICETQPPRASDMVLRRESVKRPDGSAFSVTPEAVSRTRNGDPRRLHRRLAGDIDHIVLMALDKEPGQRYASAQQFADDIHSYLEGRAVRAHRSTLAYRGRKFIGRHRWQVVAAAALLLSVLGFGVAMAFQRSAAARQRDRAERVTEFVIDLFEGSTPYSDAIPAWRQGITAREVLDLGAARLTAGLEDQPELRASLQATVGSIYLNLGLFDEARALLESGLVLRRRHLGDDHLEVAQSLFDRGHLNLQTGRLEAAESDVEEALRIRHLRLGDRHSDVVRSLRLLAAVRLAQGEAAAAEPLLTEALEVVRHHRDGSTPEAAETLHELALLYLAQGDYDRAESQLGEVLEMRRRRLGHIHPDVAKTTNDLATTFLSQGRYGEAGTLYRESLDQYRRLFGDRHPLVAEGLTNLGSVSFHSGDLAGAAARYREALELHRQLLGEEHPMIATVLNNLAVVAGRQRDFAAAEDLYRRSLAIRRQVLGHRHPDVAESLTNLGALLRARGDLGEAEGLFEEALDLRRQVLDPRHPDLANSLRWLAALYEDRGAFAQALPLAQEAQEILESALGSEDWRLAIVESLLGGCLVGVERYQEAEPLLLGSLEQLRAQRGDRDPNTRSTLKRLVALYQGWGRPDTAAEYQTQLAAAEGDPAP